MSKLKVTPAEIAECTHSAGEYLLANPTATEDQLIQYWVSHANMEEEHAKSVVEAICDQISDFDLYCHDEDRFEGMKQIAMNSFQLDPDYNPEEEV